MPPEAPQNQTSLQQRTFLNIYAEKGEEYPRRKRHTILNKRDREDFLTIAYSLMTRSRSDALELILGKTRTDRATVLMSFKPIGSQLGLWGIIKKIISYDQGSDVTTPSVTEVETILLEMEDKFLPKKIPTGQSGPTFFGLPVKDERVLAAVSALQIKHIPPEPIRKIVPPSLPVQAVIKPVAVRVATTIQPQRPPIFAAPRRGFQRQDPGNRKWVIPHHVRQEIDKTTPLLSPSKPEAVSPAKKFSFPNFPRFDDALAWLRKQEKWKYLYQDIVSKRDDIAAMASLREKSAEELLSALIYIKRLFQSQTIRAIVQDVLVPPVPVPASVSTAPTPPVKSDQPPTLPSVSTILPQTEKPLTVTLTPEHEAEIKRVFSLHVGGEYRTFWDQCGQFDDAIMGEISQVQKSFGHGSLLESIFFIGGQEITKNDKNIYGNHRWYNRIRLLPGVVAQCQRLLDRGKEAKKMKIIEAILGDIEIAVPDKRIWQGIEEGEVSKRTLLDVVLGLVKTRKTYEKKDEESTKKILHVVKQIMDLEAITADDEDLPEEK